MPTMRNIVDDSTAIIMPTMRIHAWLHHLGYPMAPIGGFLVTELLKQVAAAEIPLFTGVKVDELVMTDNQITSVKATTANGNVTIMAGAVLLATGGFGANPGLLSKYRDDLVGYQTTNQPGATGDGILLAEAIGAKAVDMDQVQVHPTVQQDTDHAYLIGEAVRGEGAILVDQSGQRFVNELDTRKTVTAAIDQLGGTGAYLIFDRGIRDRVKAVEFYDYIGLVKTGSSVAELAEVTVLDATNLTATVATWNQAVAQQHDAQFERTTGMDRAVATGPFYSIHIAPAVHYTMGGVAINTATQVLNQQEQPINGLFAAGEVVGGLHGNNRIGGNSIAETVIFGRQAGQQMFKYLQA